MSGSQTKNSPKNIKRVGKKVLQTKQSRNKKLGK